jgi:hypothetical protein
MKTVIDAVNEFKGIWPYNDSLVMYFFSGANGYGYYSKEADYNGVTAFTSEKFNKCVDELSKAEWMSKPKPVYTQAMADNGELPVVGMECMVFEHTVEEWLKGVVCGVHCEIPVIRIHNSKGEVGYFDSFQLHQIKPLTPAIELIDGKAYQFDYKEEYALIGICHTSTKRKLKHVMFCMPWLNAEYNSIYCTNIKILTV